MTVSLAVAQPTAVAPRFDDGIRQELRWTMILGGLFFGGFLAWAGLTPLDAGAFARGIVEVAGNRQAVQHREGGTVAALFVGDNQLVKKGQPLLRIASGDIAAEERGLASEYYMLAAQNARLIAEQRGAPEISRPSEFTLLAPADATLAKEAMATQAAVLRVKRNALSAQKAVLSQRAAQSRAQIGGIADQRTANREQRKTIVDELDGLRSLAERGYVTKTRLRALERAAAGLDGDFGAQAADIAKSREAIGEQAMQSTLLDRDSLKDVNNEIRDVALRLNELRPRLGAARERLARSILRAPASGRVVGLTAFTVGGVVAPGQTIMQIVPQDRELIIKAKIAPDDADDVRAGMPTKIRFPSIHGRTTAPISGTLVAISADHLIDDRSGTSFFEGEVRVPVSELRKLTHATDGVSPIRPGLPAEVLIPLAKRTVLQYLLEPVTQSFWRSGLEH
ncbi:HlyD family type I secretion periplasmic adaptor subunit [Sphingomonas sp.]|uniref:HlyD family type I secretion periplasmic adaptor subunit n=1 Tax=Sphingomonas sp. TaxID=28214 RepID=UPI0025E64B9E|nr:HlyD family type I secretion periplasmic adaptor subunit [Sphingomonas sp.]